MAWVVSEKGKKVLKLARAISIETEKVIEGDSYLNVLERHSIGLIKR